VSFRSLDVCEVLWVEVSGGGMYLVVRRCWRMGKRGIIEHGRWGWGHTSRIWD
jgi:hypothetical protein